MIYMWDYRYFWGVFFVFYVGKLIREKKLKELRIWWLALLVVVVANIYLCDAYAFELPFAVLVGIPLVYKLSQLKFKSKFNNLCGALSYHIFLNHSLIMYISVWCFGNKNAIFIIIFSFLFGLLAYKFIEKPIERIRFKSIS